MKNKKGYTLVELIITLAVVSIMIVPIFNAFLESNRINLISKRQISSAYVAQNVMEELKASDQTYLESLLGVNNPLNTFQRDSANTTFDVSVVITKESALLTALDVRNVSQDPIPTTDITINIPLIGNNGSVTFADATATSIAFNTDVVDFRSTLDFHLGTQMSLNILGETSYFTPLLLDAVSVKVVGPGDAVWIMDWLNLMPTHVLEVYPANNDLSNIRSSLDAVNVSLSDVLIFNSRPLLVGDVNQAKEWYRVTIRVEHDGTVYETLDSTIGK